MNVYILIEASGEYEDYRETMVAAYMSKEAAEQAKHRLETENRRNLVQSKKCGKCPLYLYEQDDGKFEDIRDENMNYCKNIPFVTLDNYNYTHCDECVIWYDECKYFITEMKVEE